MTAFPPFLLVAADCLPAQKKKRSQRSQGRLRRGHYLHRFAKAFLARPLSPLPVFVLVIWIIFLLAHCFDIALVSTQTALLASVSGFTFRPPTPTLPPLLPMRFRSVMLSRMLS